MAKPFSFNGKFEKYGGNLCRELYGASMVGRVCIRMPESFAIKLRKIPLTELPETPKKSEGLKEGV